jgi:hypothetical protein
MPNPSQAAQRAAEKIEQTIFGELEMHPSYAKDYKPEMVAIIDAEFAPILEKKDDEIQRLKNEVAGFTEGRP